MFDKAINFNKPLNAWDVGEVINMTWMFYGASSFNQDLNGWDVSKVSCFQDESGQVTYSGAWIYGMFEGASSFNQELNAWNVSIVTALTGASASSSFAAFILF
jgi:surface protein